MAALHRGDTVLITGGTGWIGSHVVHEALSAGLRVRLAVRSEAKAQILLDALKMIHRNSDVEVFSVPDLGQEGAFNDILKGVEGVIHTAVDFSMAPDLDKLTSSQVATTKSLLEAAYSQKQLRRLVITSSSVAMGFPNAGGEQTQYFDTHSWNEAALKQVKNSPNMYAAYAAGKVLSERAVMDFVKEENPHFSMAAILPNSTFGAAVPGMDLASSGQMIVDTADGKPSLLIELGPQWHSDVGDVAKLHVLGVTSEEVKNERIIAFATRYTVKSLIETIKKIKPDSLVSLDSSEQSAIEDNTQVNAARANQLLKDQGGLKDLEYSLRGNLQK